MNLYNIQHFINDTQYLEATKEGGEMVERKSKTHFVQSLIRDNAKYIHNVYCLPTSSLTLRDKKLLLSYIVDPFEYEWLTQNQTRLDAGFDEYDQSMQYLIDTNLSEVYSDIQEEEKAMHDYYSYKDASCIARVL